MPLQSKLDPGSSPRLRGTLPYSHFHIHCSRFIPASAGNSCGYAPSGRSNSVHPRVCGELPFGGLQRACSIGSSPRLRGTRLAVRRLPARFRFIPASAGNSLPTTMSATRSTVHPRVCGELNLSRHVTALDTGSSPRLRGTHLVANGHKPGIRFIPASAGNSFGKATVAIRNPVHPRVCGELMIAFKSLGKQYGSSPRLRGTRGKAGLSGAVHRFIPASAGNSWSPRLPRIRTPVHPRVCGELPGLVLATAPVFGSSPRLRGTLLRARPLPAPNRFIPASAGNSDPCAWCSLFRSVHPRVCGELDPVPAPVEPRAGSSPRLRGTLDSACRQHGIRRFIPASAGNSLSRSGIAYARSVHPRVCGELSGCSALINRRINDVKERTDRSTFVLNATSSLFRQRKIPNFLPRAVK